MPPCIHYQGGKLNMTAKISDVIIHGDFEFHHLVSESLPQHQIFHVESLRVCLLFAVLHLGKAEQQFLQSSQYYR